MAKWTLTGQDPERSIYLLTRTTKAPSYDVVNSMVVRAFDEQEARKLASEKAMDEGSYIWLEANHSYCEELTSVGESQVVCLDSTDG